MVRIIVLWWLNDLIFNHCNSHLCCQRVLQSPVNKNIQLPVLLYRCYHRYRLRSSFDVSFQQLWKGVQRQWWIAWGERVVKMLLWTERVEETEGFGQIWSKADFKRGTEKNVTKGKKKLVWSGVSRIKAHGSHLNLSFFIFCRSALDRDYTGRSARETER